MRTRPKAPSESWWQIKTTERWKNEPRSWTLSSSNWPLSDWKSPVITLLERICPRLAALTMGITLRHDDPNFADRFAARHTTAGERMQNKRRQPRIHSRPGLGADAAVGVCDRFNCRAGFRQRRSRIEGKLDVIWEGCVKCGEGCGRARTQD